MATSSYITSANTFNRAAIMSAAWASARSMILPPRPIRGYTPPPRPTLREAFKQALRRAWDLARGQIACAKHRAAEAAKVAAIADLPQADRVIVETARTVDGLHRDYLAASMIDSLPAMIAEQAAIQARAAALGVRL